MFSKRTGQNYASTQNGVNPPIDYVISAKNVGKCYQLYAQPHDRLKQFLWAGRRQYYREFWALRDVSFELRKGQVLGIIGRNGAGKSTLLQLLCKTLNPSHGHIEVHGRVAALLELGAGFNPEFTGRENVFMSATILGLEKNEIHARFDEIVDFSGIREFIDQPVKTYSSGMYVRLAFAVATSVDPDILVVDEALSVGDGEFAHKSFDRIRRMKEAGKTILFCSHSMYQVEAFCDQVIWLDHGGLKLLGEPQAVVRQYNNFLLNGMAGLPPTASAKSLQGHARISLIEVSLDGKVDKVLHGCTGKNELSIRLQFESDPTLPAPAVGVELKFGPLITVACIVSRSDQVVIERDEDGRGEVGLSFPALPLRKGEYFISVYLGSEDALHIFDHADAFATLYINDPLPEPGLVTLVHQWHSSAGHPLPF